jgi:outer membrane protein TolC
VKKISTLTFLLLLSGLGTLNAQTLTLSESIDKALQTHPDIKRFILQQQRSEKGVDVARADYLPQITLSAEYDPTKTYVLPMNGVFNTRDEDGWMAGATLRQKIWDFSKTTSLIRAQEVQQEIAGLSLQEAKALLAYKVKLQYELALVQQKAIEVRRKDLQVKEELYKQAKGLLEQGLRTSADVTRFVSSTSVAKDNLAIAKANLAKAKNALALYIGSPLPADIVLEEPVMITDARISSQETILANSPALQSLQKNIRKNELLHKAAKGARFGSIDGIASYSYQDTLNDYDATLMGITLTVPLYSGGRLSAQEEQAAIDSRTAKHAYQSKVLELREEVESLLIDVKRYGQTIKAKQEQYLAASQTKEVVDGRYKEGLATYIEVLDATAQMLDAQLGQLQATFDKSSTIHRLEYLQGMSK